MTLSIVIPMYKTSANLSELLSRLAAAMPPGTEVVLVDDACPQESWKLALTLPPSPLELKVLRLTANVGQYAAVQVGLSHATGSMIAIMDADLQDSPESLPALVELLDDSPEFDAVCSVRAGKYESITRRWTARLYRRTATALSRGRIPLNAGMFMVMRRASADRLFTLRDPFVPIVPGLARTGTTMKGIQVHRQPRLVGRSSYSILGRLRLAARGLITLSPFHIVLIGINRRKWTRIGCHVVVVSGQHPD